MGNDNMWGDEDPFSDMPEEARTINGQPGMSPGVPHQYAAPVVPPPSAQPVQKRTLPVETYEPEPAPVIEVAEQVFEEEDDDSEVLNDANLRLEQGSLYKMIMKHDLFAGVDADPKAVQNVQKAIRKFAREQMEIMLGMRRETSTIEHLEIDFPFNVKEVEVLKALVRTATKGLSEYSDRFVPEVKRVTEEVGVVASKRTTLNPIAGNVAKKTNPITKQASKPESKPLPSKPQSPVKRTKLDDVIDRIAREEGIPRELLEENQLLNKPVAELTSQELLERDKSIALRRGRQVKSSQAVPMPSPEQQEMLISNQVSRSNTTSDPLMRRILETVKAMPAKDPFVDPFKQ